MDRVADIVGGITMLALVAILVGSRNTPKLVTAVGKAYAGALNAATRPAR